MKIQRLAGLLIAVFVVTACGGGNNDNSTPTFSAPAGVKAQIVTVGSDKTIQVSWTAVPDAAKYAIYMASIAGVTKLNWSNDPIGGMHHPDLTAAFPHPAGLDPNTIYYFIVTAINAVGEETTESCEAAAKINDAAGGVCGQ